MTADPAAASGATRTAGAALTSAAVTARHGRIGNADRGYIIGSDEKDSVPGIAAKSSSALSAGSASRAVSSQAAGAPDRTCAAENTSHSYAVTPVAASATVAAVTTIAPAAAGSETSIPAVGGNVGDAYISDVVRGEENEPIAPKATKCSPGRATGACSASIAADSAHTARARIIGAVSTIATLSAIAAVAAISTVTAGGISASATDEGVARNCDSIKIQRGGEDLARAAIGSDDRASGSAGSAVKTKPSHAADTASCSGAAVCATRTIPAICSSRPCYADRISAVSTLMGCGGRPKWSQRNGEESGCEKNDSLWFSHG